jgi:hypothetical protein
MLLEVPFSVSWASSRQPFYKVRLLEHLFFKSPDGLLDHSTLFTVYGRSFRVAPVLGRLGQYRNFDDMAKDVAPFATQIDALNGPKNVMIGVHLIYAMARPCTVPADSCLSYIEGTSGDLEKNYVIPPRRGAGW